MRNRFKFSSVFFIFFLIPNLGRLKTFGTHPLGLGVGLKPGGRVKLVNHQQG